MRRAAKTWVATILVGLLVVAFAVWGVQDIFKGGRDTTLAKVGDDELDVRTFENEYARRLRSQINEAGQPMTAAEGRAAGLDRAVLDDMVADLAVLEEARRLKLSASDDMVRAALYSFQGLVGPDGNIDRDAFLRALQDIGYTEGEFLSALRYDLMRAQLLQTAAIGAPAPRGFGLALQAYANERRVVEYVVLPPEKAGEIAAPDDAALQAYLEANKATYTAPELRGVTYLAIGPKDIIPTIDIPDDAVKAEYEAQKQRYETLETRELQQIVYPTKEDAEAAHAQLASGKTFEDLVADRKLKAEDVALGTITKGDPAVPAGAFGIAEGQVSAPLEGPFGWALVKVIKVHPGSVKSFEDVRQEVRDGLAMDKARDQISDLVTKMQDALAATDSLEEAGKELNLTVRTIPAIDAQGRDGDGKPIEGLPDGPGFLGDVFGIGQGEHTDVSETPEHVIYAVRVDSVSPSALRPLASIRDKIAAAWLAEEQAKKLKALAEDLAKTANSGSTSLADLAKANALEAKTSESIARDAPVNDLSAEVIGTLFATKAGTWVAGPGQAPRYVVARVKDVTRAESPDALAEERKLRSEATTATSDDLAEIYRQEIVKATPVTINESLYEQTKTRGQQ
ncbi:MAG: SurA N-terminal domain-containing protein [Alphaproteobacteria bacterium]|nr:SurA N-terminal domain-containing protein [Alphaproteobacteria bacterium]